MVLDLFVQTFPVFTKLYCDIIQNLTWGSVWRIFLTPEVDSNDFRLIWKSTTEVWNWCVEDERSTWLFFGHGFLIVFRFFLREKKSWVLLWFSFFMDKILMTATETQSSVTLVDKTNEKFYYWNRHYSQKKRQTNFLLWKLVVDWNFELTSKMNSTRNSASTVRSAGLGAIIKSA